MRPLKNNRLLGRGDIDHYRMEKQYINRDGDSVWGILDANLIRNNNFEPIYFLGSVKNITERKKMENSLYEKNVELEHILNSIPEAMMYTDSKRNIRRVNRAFTRIFGYEGKRGHRKEYPGTVQVS